MGVLVKLKEKGLFSVAEQEIAKYILSNPQEAIRMSIRQIATASYASPTSVMRLCHKICEGGYTEFRLLLAAELSEYTSNVIVSNEEEILAKEMRGVTEITHQLEQSMIESIRATRRMMVPEMLIEIVDLILSSKVVDIYGRGNSYGVGSDFHYKIFRLGIVSQIYKGVEMQFLQANNSDLTHCALIISASGETPEIVKIAEILDTKGTPIITLTGTQVNTLQTHSNHPLYFKSLETHLKVGAITSRSAMEYVLDTLYFLIFNTNYENNTKKVLANYTPIDLVAPNFK